MFQVFQSVAVYNAKHARTGQAGIVLRNTVQQVKPPKTKDNPKPEPVNQPAAVVLFDADGAEETMLAADLIRL